MWLALKIVLPIFVLLFCGIAVPMVAADPAPPPKTNVQTNGSGVLQGRLLKIEGESYTVKDTVGKEVRVRVGKDSVVDARIKVGDKVDVQMGSDGHAVTVLKALE